MQLNEARARPRALHVSATPQLRDAAVSPHNGEVASARLEILSDPFDYRVVDVAGHRPWPLPAAPWVMTQSWNNLLFAHWRADATALARHVPAGFDIDCLNGDAWLSVVPFYMTNVRVRCVPPVPGASSFGEVNVRTYVRRAGKAGVFFFSLDAESVAAVWGAYTALNLPYYTAAMTIANDTQVRYESRRRADSRRSLVAQYAPAGAPMEPQPGTLDYFLTERYCLYATSRRGRPYRLEIHHRPWLLQPATARLSDVSIAAGLHPADRPPELLHFARRQDVVAWLPARA
jgi:uncharacterized protein YqjF (DUF2071 family)